MTKKTISVFSTALTWLLAACSQPSYNLQNALPALSFYSFKMKDIDGNEIDFSEYKGKKVLIVNVASRCGNTPQYAGLEKLHQQYGDKVIVLGFPANNFLHQEPGTNADIKSFCKQNYNVTFKMFEKISVKGNDMAPLYSWLSDKKNNGWNNKQPDWNFAKYLVNETGELIAFFPARTNPLDEKIISKIKNNLMIPD